MDQTIKSLPAGTIVWKKDGGVFDISTCYKVAGFDVIACKLTPKYETMTYQSLYNRRIMSFGHNIYDETENVHMGDATIPVRFVIQNDYETFAHFNFFGDPYAFDVTKWRARGLRNLMINFLENRNVPVASFGQLDNDGLPTQVTPDQKMCIVIQAMKDVLQTVSQILLKHGRGILDYAVWYRENGPNDAGTPYQKYITEIACHCIVHTSFIAPRVDWELVLFEDQYAM